MATAHLYNLHVKSADPTQATADFIAEQRKLTNAAKRGIKSSLAEKGLSGEFEFAAKRIPAIARSFQIYATPAALEVISTAKNVEKVERMPFSAYGLTKKI